MPAILFLFAAGAVLSLVIIGIMAVSAEGTTAERWEVMRNWLAVLGIGVVLAGLAAAYHHFRAPWLLWLAGAVAAMGLFGAVSEAWEERARLALVAARIRREAQEEANRREADRQVSERQRQAAERERQAGAAAQAQDARALFARNLQQCETDVLNKWSHYRVSEDFTGTKPPAELLEGFRRSLLTSHTSNLGILRHSQHPTIRQIYSNGAGFPLYP